jgi:hypothetical protein
LWTDDKISGVKITTKLRIKLIGSLLVALLFAWLLIHPGRPGDLTYTIGSTVFITSIVVLFGRSAVDAARKLRLYSN